MKRTAARIPTSAAETSTSARTFDGNSRSTAAVRVSAAMNGIGVAGSKKLAQPAAASGAATMIIAMAMAAMPGMRRCVIDPSPGEG